jgi:hypothetical protein
MNVRILTVLVLPLLLASCQPRIPEADLLPPDLHEIRVLILLEDGVDPSEVGQLIIETNRSLIQQSGLYLVPVESRVVEFPSRKRQELLQSLLLSSWDSRDEFDLCFGFVRRTPGDRIKRLLVGDWLGLIDDTYRRYIVIKDMNKRVLAHEVYHAFIFSTVHSGCGIMSAQVELIPGVPLNYSMRLCGPDRAEVLENRNRCFNTRVAERLQEPFLVSSEQ